MMWSDYKWVRKKTKFVHMEIWGRVLMSILISTSISFALTIPAWVAEQQRLTELESQWYTLLCKANTNYKPCLISTKLTPAEPLIHLLQHHQVAWKYAVAFQWIIMVLPKPSLCLGTPHFAARCHSSPISLEFRKSLTNWNFPFFVSAEGML